MSSMKYMPLTHVYEMDLNLLPALDALLEERSVTRAAHRVGVSQPAMSRSLARLRVVLGDELLVRAGRGLVPTPQGQALRSQLHEVLERLELALAEPGAFDPARTTRTFRVATADYGMAVVVPTLLARLAASAPGVRLLVSPQSSSDEASLAEGDLDALIAPRRGTAPGLVWTPLLSDDWVAVVSRGQVARGRVISLEAYCRLGHVFVSPALAETGVVDVALARLGRSRRIAARVPSFLVAPVIAARAGLVATVGRRIATLFSQPEVRVLELPVEIPPVTVSLAWHERVRRDPAHRWFRSVVTKAFSPGR